MTAPEDRDPVATAQGLTEALKGVTAELKRLAEYGHRNRQLIITVLISLAVDVILTVAVALVAVQAHDASARASTAAASNLALCQAGNVARQQQIDLWTYVIGLPAGKPRTAQEAANVAAFEKHLRILFAPRDCAALGKKG